MVGSKMRAGIEVLGLWTRMTTLLATILVAASVQAAEPLSPEAARQAFVLHPQCSIQLVAAEPDVVSPVHIAFGPDGRMWVVEYSDYPNGPDPGNPGKSRIRVLSDADGDGRYSDPVIFAEGLLFANSLMLWRDGAIVTTDGKLLFLRDTTGDGVADEQQEWFAGFVTENPQLRCNHPTLGLDGWIYVANGLRGGEIVPGKDFPWERPADAPPPEPVNISGMDFRFNPRTGQCEAVTGNGQFGLTFDDYGNRFVCSNRNPNRHVVLEDQWLKLDPQLQVESTLADVSPAAEQSKLFPISRTWTTSNLHANQFTAACGVTIYRGSALVAEFYGSSFTCEPTANLVHRDILSPAGATFTSRYDREGIEFLASPDEWFRPVNLAHGPAGGLYVVDMYRAVIEHPQFMPDELKNRPDLLLGTDRGRIWMLRDQADGPIAAPSPVSVLNAYTQGELVRLLEHPNAWHRETAFRLLLEQSHPDLPKLLHALVRQSTDPRAHTLSLWLLHLVDGLTAEDLRLAQKLDKPELHEQIVQLVRREADKAVSTIGDARLTYISAMLPELYDQVASLSVSTPPGDPNEKLLFRLLIACPAGGMPLHRLGAFAETLEKRGEDPFFRYAALRGADRNTLMLLTVLTQRELEGTGGYPEGRLPAVRELFRLVALRQDEFDTRRILERAFTSRSTGQPTPERKLSFRAQVIFGLTEALRGQAEFRQLLDKCAASAREEVIATLDSARKLLQEGNLSDAQRNDAVQLLGYDSRPEARGALTSLLDQPQLAPLAVEVLGQFTDPGVANLLLKRFAAATPSVKSRILQVMTTSTERCGRLLDEIEAQRIPALEVAPATVQRLLKHRDAAVRDRAAKVLDAARPQDRAQVIASYQPCLRLPSDMARGREVFTKNCATCHRIGDIGVNVAPDISDSRTKTVDYLLTHILDPNAAIDNNYFNYTIVDVQGRIHTGVIHTETSNGVTLRQPEGKSVTIPRAEIEEMKSTGLSLMPEGLEKNIDLQQMADLIGFVKNWRYADGAVPVAGGSGP